MTDVRIIQGRLLRLFSRLFHTFAATRRRDEFHHAHEAGLVRIKWIYEKCHKKKVNAESEVGIRSTCVSVICRNSY
jgi:hypothetical protein